MTFFDLKKTLSEVIFNNLTPLISKESILLDLPYYTNIGDTLIWQGTECFLQNNGVKCFYRTSCENFRYKKISQEVTILLQGGGNWGDVWRRHQDFRNKIIELYPNNPIVVLPQTIYYEDEQIMIQDAAILNKHPNLTLCARDQFSYDLLNEHFTNSRNLLLPDMAYCISEEILDKYKVDSDPDKALYLKRNDREFNTGNNIDEILQGESRKIYVRDWPSMDNNMVMNLYPYIYKINKICCGAISGVIDMYMYNTFRPDLTKQGVQFVSSYSAIYTTRLHVAILSSLLEKPFVFMNNSYGKNKQFYDTWLSQCDQIKFKS